ncbi:MAG: SCO family protein [Desulfofustis sp.]|jgi:protein SCO1/2|nr:SCO family protein [Desulfofustis sp.]
MMELVTNCTRRISRLACLVCIGVLLAALIPGCNLSPREPLPVFGTVEIPYTFTDQDGKPINQKMLSGRIYVADFFFTTCPTICPIMKTQMLRIYEAYRDSDQLVLVSHSIDPEHDTVEALHDYGSRLGISAQRWHLVTGIKDEIYDTAKRYGLAALEDKNAAGGFIHSGSFSLVDRQGRIRGYYQGTDTHEVDTLIQDIRRLLDEG